MYRLGHQGANLLLFAPVFLALVLAGHAPLGVLGVAVVFTTASLPDIDLQLPLVAHRGITHTVWAVAAVGAIGAGAAWLAAGAFTDLVAGLGITRVSVAIATGGLLAFSVLGHLIADGLTPMGVRPWQPLSDRSYSLSVCTADSWLGNRVLFAAGVLATGSVLGLVLTA